MAFSASVDSITETSARFTAEFTGGAANYSRYRYVNLVFSDGTSYLVESTTAGGADSDFEMTVSGLKPGTFYSWEATLGYVEQGEIEWTKVTDSGSFYTEETTVPIDYWSWESSNGSATNLQTRTAYNILRGTQPADNFSHNVWNDLVDKVMELRTARHDGTWDRRGGLYLYQYECYVLSGDTLSAAIYNSVKYNASSIPGGVGSGIADVDAGDELTGYHIIRLAQTINENIDALT